MSASTAAGAAAETHAKAERAIRAVLTEYLTAHPALFDTCLAQEAVAQARQAGRIALTLAIKV